MECTYENILCTSSLLDELKSRGKFIEVQTGLIHQSRYVCTECKEKDKSKSFVSIYTLKKHLLRKHAVKFEGLSSGPSPKIKDPNLRKEMCIENSMNYYYEHRDDILEKQKVQRKARVVTKLVETYSIEELRLLHSQIQKTLEEMVSENEVKKHEKHAKAWIYGALIYEVDDQDVDISVAWSLSTKEEFTLLTKKMRQTYRKQATDWLTLPYVKKKVHRIRCLWNALKEKENSSLVAETDMSNYNDSNTFLEQPLGHGNGAIESSTNFSIQENQFIISVDEENDNFESQDDGITSYDSRQMTSSIDLVKFADDIRIQFRKM